MYNIIEINNSNIGKQLNKSRTKIEILIKCDELEYSIG